MLWLFPAPVQSCDGQEICANGYQCYPRAKACDEKTDCLDKSDEWNCLCKLTLQCTYEYPQHGIIYRACSTMIDTLRGRSMLGHGGHLPPDSLVAPPQIQKLADHSDVISEVPKCSKIPRWGSLQRSPRPSDLWGGGSLPLPRTPLWRACCYFIILSVVFPDGDRSLLVSL